MSEHIFHLNFWLPWLLLRVTSQVHTMTQLYQTHISLTRLLTCKLLFWLPWLLLRVTSQVHTMTQLYQTHISLTRLLTCKLLMALVSCKPNVALYVNTFCKVGRQAETVTNCDQCLDGNPHLSWFQLLLFVRNTNDYKPTRDYHSVTIRPVTFITFQCTPPLKVYMSGVQELGMGVSVWKLHSAVHIANVVIGNLPFAHRARNLHLQWTSRPEDCISC